MSTLFGDIYYCEVWYIYWRLTCIIFSSYCEDSPNITFLTEDQTVTVNSPVNITCRVNTFPSSNITWYLDNDVLNTSLVSTTMLDNRIQESTVTIGSVSTTDSGTYKCEASNIISTTNMNTSLTVESECTHT